MKTVPLVTETVRISTPMGRREVSRTRRLFAAAVAGVMCAAVVMCAASTMVAGRSVAAGEKPESADAKGPDAKGSAIANSDKSIAKNPVKVTAAEAADPVAFAARIDAALSEFHRENNITPAARCNDADFLRRVSLDLTGTAGGAEYLTAFALDSDSDKRRKLIDQLIESPKFAENLARYWRDVLFTRATEARARLAQESFEEWFAEELRSKKSWADITTALVTSIGSVGEDGHTALMFAHTGEPEEVASEASRMFLGIQIQCANCHDHPTDQWKREQFHELAAFFPRVKVDRKRGGDARFEFEVASFEERPAAKGAVAARLQAAKAAASKRKAKKPAAGAPSESEGMMAEKGEAGMAMKRLDQREMMFEEPEAFFKLADRDGNGKFTREEAQRGPNKGKFFDQLLANGDTDKDSALSLEEIKKMPRPEERPGRGSAEHYMADLENPSSKGKEIAPRFFLSGDQPGKHLSDHDRRAAVAKYITSPANQWFAKAFVNRVWKEMLGEGFYMPVDDIGPDRTATAPQVLDLLAAGFVASGYNVQWLFRCIANTEAYQRETRIASAESGLMFAAVSVHRLRADLLFDELTRVLGLGANAAAQRGKAAGQAARYGMGSPRAQFNQLFGFDPSSLPDEVTGTIPQALFFMNSSQINSAVRARGNTRLAALLSSTPDDGDLITELFLLVHSREPSATEHQACLKYVKSVGSRAEAFEDVLWSLVNSTEFMTKR